MRKCQIEIFLDFWMNFIFMNFDKSSRITIRSMPHFLLLIIYLWVDFCPTIWRLFWLRIGTHCGIFASDDGRWHTNRRWFGRYNDIKMYIQNYLIMPEKVEKPYQVIEGHNSHIHYLFIKTQVLSNLIKNQLCYSTCMLQSKLYISNIFTWKSNISILIWYLLWGRRRFQNGSHTRLFTRYGNNRGLIIWSILLISFRKRLEIFLNQNQNQLT